MLLDQVKAAAFKAQLIRQITQGNSLGALLCVRSLIEHRALAAWLPQEVGVSLDTLAEARGQRSHFRRMRQRWSNPSLIFSLYMRRDRKSISDLGLCTKMAGYEPLG